MLNRDIFRYLLSRLLPAIVNFLALAVFSRIVAPAAYGAFAYVFAIVAFFHAVAFRWIEQGLQRLYPTAHSAQEKHLIVNCSFLLMIPTYCVCGACLLLASQFGLVELRLDNLEFWVLGFLAGFAINEMLLETKRAEIRPWHYGALATVRASASFTISAVLVWNNRHSPVGLLVGTAGAYLAVGLVGTILQLKRPNKPASMSKVARQIAVFGLPLVLSNFFLYLITTSDRLIIANLRSEAEVGLYSMGYDFVQQTIIVLTTIVNLAAYPLLVRVYEDDGEGAAVGYLPGILAALLVVSLPISILFMMNGGAISRWYFGEMYAATIAAILPPVTLAMVLASVKAFYADQAFLLSRKTMHLLLPIAVGGLVNVGANFYVIPRWGIVGAAWTTVLGYSLALILSVANGRRFLKVPWPARVLGKIACACAVEALILFIWPPAESLVVEIIRSGIACTVFVAIAWQTGLLRVARAIKRA